MPGRARAIRMGRCSRALNFASNWRWLCPLLVQFPAREDWDHREHLPILIARALPGIGLEHLPVPPQELPRRAHSVYFSVNYHSDQWALVQKNNNIALYWDNAPEDLEAELMVVGR